MEGEEDSPVEAEGEEDSPEDSEANLQKITISVKIK